MVIRPRRIMPLFHDNMAVPQTRMGFYVVGDRSLEGR